jgi:cohesin complex subunit SA-1/2
MSALVDIALSISIQKDQSQRQYEAERQKSTARRAADRLETLTAKRKEVCDLSSFFYSTSVFILARRK